MAVAYTATISRHTHKATWAAIQKLKGSPKNSEFNERAKYGSTELTAIHANNDTTVMRCEVRQ